MLQLLENYIRLFYAILDIVYTIRIHPGLHYPLYKGAMQIAKTLLTNLERISQVIRQLSDKIVTRTHCNIMNPMLCMYCHMAI